jgi:hypothetical protein
MAYRINGHFSDKMAPSQLKDNVGEPIPKLGDTVSLTLDGHTVVMRVTAIWRSPAASGSVVTVEAHEI